MTIEERHLKPIFEIQKKSKLIERQFTKQGIDPLGEVEWVKRDSVITNPDGSVVFEMRGIEAPKNWSQLAVDIAASKYFRKAGLYGDLNHGETSVRQLVSRVAKTIRWAGQNYGYFANDEEAVTFEAELTYILVNQFAAFNSPVWFNVGLFHQYGIEGSGGSWCSSDIGPVETNNAYEHPQSAACFLTSVKDDLMDIYGLVQTEARLFKGGSGTGTNFSKIRGKQEKLSSGGKSSGLMSFLEVLDRAAGAIKSGGTTRRAAKLVCLDMDHPEIVDFIQWKSREEKKAKALIAQGYPSDFNGDAYHTVSGQNSNNSVRLTDEFMKAVENNGSWSTKARTTGEIIETYKARDLWNMICQSAWECADPGVQFDTTTNAWHTVPNSGRINESNPCIRKGMKIHTEEGYQPIESLVGKRVKINDLVGMAHAEVWKTGTKPIVRVNVDTGDFIDLTEDHRVYTFEKGWVEAKNLVGLMVARYSPETGRLAAPIVTSVEALGIEDEVYDFNCSTTHMGLVEGFVVHNCGEFLHLSDTACNLASINLTKFYDGRFDVKAYRHTIRTMIIAQEILVDFASYPTKAIALNSHDFRPLGLGYANLGAMIMCMGHPYDSDEGRNVAACVTAILTGHAYGVSAEIAERKQAFNGFRVNQESMLDVMRKHADAAQDVEYDLLGHAAREDWHRTIELGEKYGYRNAQISVCAPTGTIGLLMDCDTTGIEPDFSLVKFKKLAGGGTMKIVNQSVSYALERLKYSHSQIADIKQYIETYFTIEGAPHLKAQHTPIFDCANRSGDGGRFIEPMGHIRMLAATTPFWSGGISKTINCPNETTVEEISELYMAAWKAGLKSVALYRDGCKASQPLNSNKTESLQAPLVLQKRKLPNRRKGFTQKARVAGNKLFIRTGEYEDGTLGEIFLDMHKEGAAFRSLMNALAQAVSMGLQHGVPLQAFVNQFTYTRFEPSGVVEGHPHIKMATSLLDYIFRHLAIEYLKDHEFAHVKPEEVVQDVGTPVLPPVKDNELYKNLMGDAPMCDQCGHLTVRNASCYRCLNCGNSMGCS